MASTALFATRTEREFPRAVASVSRVKGFAPRGSNDDTAAFD
jgi:hypothetical protein